MAHLLLERQVEAMERPPGETKAFWPWLLVLAGVLAVAALSVHGAIAYGTLAGLDARSNTATANPVVLFQDVATNGPRVGNTVDSSNRASYSRALEQFVLDGTGVMLGLVLAVAGLFARANL